MPSEGYSQKPAGKKLADNIPPLGTRQMKSNNTTVIPTLEKIDNIEGVLYVKDLIPHLNNPRFDWTDKIRPAFFVPENKNIDMLFKDFQEKRVHFLHFDLILIS